MIEHTIFLKKRWRKFYIKVECHVELFALTHVIIKKGHHQHFNHLKKPKSTHFFLYSELDTFFKATFKVLMVIWYDNQYFENGRSTLFTKGNCQHQHKQKIFLVGCVVVFYAVYDSLYIVLRGNIIFLLLNPIMNINLS